MLMDKYVNGKLFFFYYLIVYLKRVILSFILNNVKFFDYSFCKLYDVIKGLKIVKGFYI